jgi:putative transposase
MTCKFCLKCHIVLCVKYRRKLLAQIPIANSIKSAIINAQTREFAIQVMEVDKDHIHLLIDYSPNVSVSQIVRLIKQVSTKKVWIDCDLSRYFWKQHVFWSSGYFACSTGDASTETIAKYIANQG